MTVDRMSLFGETVNRWLFATAFGLLALLIQAPGARAQWTEEIQCSDSWLSGPEGMTCMRAADSEGGTGTGKCVFKREVMFGSYPGGFVYAGIFRNWHDRCWVTAKGTSATFADLRKRADGIFEDGHGNWSDVRIVDDAYVSEFVSNNRRCVASRTYGAPDRGGYRHVVDAFACDSPGSRAESSAFTDDEIKLRIELIRARW